MADYLPPLIAHLKADITGFAAGLGEASALAKAETGAMSTAFTGLAGIGKAALIGITVGAVAGGVASIKMASDFEKSMMLVRTQAHDTTDNIDQLGKQVLALAPTVGQGPEALAQGLYHVTSVGYRGADAIKILSEAAKEATISGADLDATTYSLTSVMNIFGAKAGQAHDYMAQLNAIVGAGDMRFKDLNAAIGTGFLSAGETFGVSLQSMGAGLAFLTDRGMHADEAATRLKMSVTLLGAPTKQSAGLLKDLGLSSEEAMARTSAMSEMLQKSGLTVTKLSDDLRKPDGLKVALEDLKDSMTRAGMTADAQAALISRAFGGGRSGAAIMAMIAQTDVLGQKFDMIGAGASRFDKDWSDTQNNFNVKMAQMKAGTEALAISVGIVLIPYVVRAMDAIANLAGWMAKNQQVAVPLAAALGGVLLVAIAAYTVAMIQAAIATIAATWPILLIIAAVALLAAGVYLLISHWSQVSGFFVNLWNTVKNATLGALSAIWGAISGFVGGVFSAIGTFFHNVVASAQKGWTEFARHPLYWIGFLVAYLPVKFAELLVFVYNWVNATIRAVAEWAAQMVWRGAQAAANFLNAVGTWLQQLPGRVASWLGNVLSTIGTWASQLPEKGTRAASDFGNAIVTELQKLPDQVGKIGENIAKGIISGLQSYAGDAIAAARDFVSGMIAGAKAAGGITSPARVFAEEIGIPISQGVAMGIRQGSPSATGALSNLISAMSGMGPGGATPSPYYGGGAGTAAPALAGSPTINVYAQTNADPHEIAREIAWAMKYQ